MGPARKTRSSARAAATAAAQFNNNDKSVASNKSKKKASAKKPVEESDEEPITEPQYESDEDIPLATKHERSTGNSSITPLKMPHKDHGSSLPVAPGTPGTPGTPGPNPVPQTPTVAPPGTHIFLAYFESFF